LDKKTKLKLLKELGAMQAMHLLQELMHLNYFIVVAQLVKPPKRG
jgi:hypothetical protein